VYRLVAGGTVEERVLQHAEKKLYLDQMVNEMCGGKKAEACVRENGPLLAI